MREVDLQLTPISATHTFTALGDGALVFQCTASSSGNITITVSTQQARTNDGTNPAVTPSFTTFPIGNLKGGQYDADGASITVAAGDMFYVNTAGLGEVKVTLNSGTCTLQVRAWDWAIDSTTTTGGASATIADDAAFGIATSLVTPAGFLADETAPDSVNEGDTGAARMTLDRRILVETTNGTLRQPTVDSFTCAAISTSANTANQSLVTTPGASKQIWVYGWGGSADTGAGSISIQDEDDTAITGVMPVAQNGGFCHPVSGNFAMPVFKVATNKALEMDTVTCGFKGWIAYAIVSV